MGKPGGRADREDRVVRDASPRSGGPTPGRAFLFLHGVQGSGPGHWQRWLAGRLEEAGETVRFPELPEPDAPRFEAWMSALDGELEALGGGRGLTVLCQSLSCALWVHRVRRGLSEPAERVVLAAPPAPDPASSERGASRHEEFFPVPLDREAVVAAAGHTRVICSDNDPHCPEGADRAWATPLGIDAQVIPGGGHLTTDDGFGPWPELEAWCLEDRSGS